MTRCTRDRHSRVDHNLHKKKCTKCDTWKPFSDYYTRAQGAAGLSSICKKCENDRAARMRKTEGFSHETGAGPNARALDLFYRLHEQYGTVTLIPPQPPEKVALMEWINDHPAVLGFAFEKCGKNWIIRELYHRTRGRG